MRLSPALVVVVAFFLSVILENPELGFGVTDGFPTIGVIIAVPVAVAVASAIQVEREDVSSKTDEILAAREEGAPTGRVGRPAVKEAAAEERTPWGSRRLLMGARLREKAGTERRRMREMVEVVESFILKSRRRFMVLEETSDDEVMVWIIG